jgi:hypothetical protein
MSKSDPIMQSVIVGIFTAVVFTSIVEVGAWAFGTRKQPTEEKRGR